MGCKTYMPGFSAFVPWVVRFLFQYRDLASDDVVIAVAIRPAVGADEFESDGVFAWDPA